MVNDNQGGEEATSVPQTSPIPIEQTYLYKHSYTHSIAMSP
jgi:hypothetical protein